MLKIVEKILAVPNRL